MEWERIRYVLVEDDEGRLVGMVSHRGVLRHLARERKRADGSATSVRDVMRKDLVTVTPETNTHEALELMRKKRIGCLPVVDQSRLVGVLTDHDFLELASVLLDRWLKDA
jgi:CBS domain-containing protein